MIWVRKLIDEKLIFKKLEEAVKMGLLDDNFVKSLDLHEDSIGIDGNKLFIAKGYTKWLFGKIDRLKIIEVDLDKKTTSVFERTHKNKSGS